MSANQPDGVSSRSDQLLLLTQQDGQTDGVSDGHLRMSRMQTDLFVDVCFDCPVLSLMATHSLFVLLFVLLLTFPSFFLSMEALLLFVRLQKFLLFLPPTPINYLNSSLEPPPSMFLYFVTADVSAVTLWPLATLLCCPGNLYSTPGFALLSNLYLPSLDIVWRQ